MTGSEREGTLHQRILSEIEGRIVSGEWPPGYRLPAEVDLAAEWGCSRMTVNKVLTQLARAGVIERRKRAGSVVARPRSQAALLEIHEVRAEVESLGQPYRYELIDRVTGKGDSPELSWPELDARTRVVRLSCLHHAGERVFCLEERLISLAAVPEAENVDFAATVPSAWLLGQVPWTAAEHRIWASAATDETARRLALPDGAPCLVVERKTWNAGQPVTCVRLTYPADAHVLTARFSPISG